MTNYRGQRQEYRHRHGRCSRLLFAGHLAPGSRIEIRCPSCGRMHIIEAAPVDSNRPYEYHTSVIEYVAEEP